MDIGLLQSFLPIEASDPSWENAPCKSIEDRRRTAAPGAETAIVDAVLRIDTATILISRLSPAQPTNIRGVLVDNSTTRWTFRLGGSNGGAMIKLEPSD